MNLKQSLRGLLLFAGLFLFAAGTAGAFCTPVVYLFRHAEDFDNKSALTPVGDAHADLYPDMVADFGAANHYCPVGFVYALYDKRPNGDPGTVNPLETARPLAIAACYNLAIYANLSTSATCGGNGAKPRMALENGKKLYEYLGATRSEQEANGATGAELRNELINRTPAGGGMSSAIFWTSQGLNILGQALVPGFTEIPGCSVPSSECNKLPKPPRNAVYVFKYSGSLPPSDNSAFVPPTSPAQYVQCYNVDISHLKGPPSGNTYYCRIGLDGGGNLPEIKDLDGLLGMICDTTGLGYANVENYYGPCD